MAVKGTLYSKNFGQHTKFSQQLAEIHLAEKRKEILQGIINLKAAPPRKKFKDVAALFFSKWSKQTDPNGKVKHTPKAVYNCKNIIDASLVPYFGDDWFDEIKPKHVQKWRDGFIAAGRVGTTANRHQAVLSSIFNHVETWVKTEQIKAFQIPPENPTLHIDKAPNRKRTRILTEYEARKLKMAFINGGKVGDRIVKPDPDGWEICKLALKSVLSLKDLKSLEAGQMIDIERAKTGVSVDLPLTVLTKLNFVNWQDRWEWARELAGLHSDNADAQLQFRDLRKTGINWLKGKYDIKLISEYAGHADVKTTEGFYTVEETTKLKPLADDLSGMVEAI